ncbi:unnamed protein product [Moneuplotes crassus]|uniref:Uncharacterized protein n=1 Tax=Euplotes crassus TaxID=5936 RepID=A0AAD1XYY5_EUPCR|nr:unnamed protein product [Moneuplotes crassus]
MSSCVQTPLVSDLKCSLGRDSKSWVLSSCTIFHFYFQLFCFNCDDAFGDKSKEQANEHKKESTIPKEKSTKEEVKEDPARQFFDFGT